MDIDTDYLNLAGVQSVFAPVDSAIAPAYNNDADEQMIDTSEEPQPPFKLSISEYDEIAQRLENSIKQLEIVRDALQSPDNLANLRQKIDIECEQLTLRILFGRKQGERESATTKGVITDIYKATLVDIDTHAFVLLKCHRNSRNTFNSGDSYLIDKVKLVINPKAEVILISTSLTVLRSESDESFEVDSLSLSQKQHDDAIMDDQSNEMLAKEGREAFQEMLKIPYIMIDETTDEPPLFTSIKQIKTESERILLEWSKSPELTPRLWSFREILCWKIPDGLLSTQARESQVRLKQRQEEENYICSYAMHTHLYQLDLVTYRVKEQKVTFVGIITHVKEFNDSKYGSNMEKNGQNLVTSHIDLESTDDKSKCSLFVKHSKKVDLKGTLKKG